MTKLACLRAGSLLAARAAGLPPADGLILERHLAECARCTREALLLDMTRAHIDAVPVASATQRERMIARVLAGGVPAQPVAARPRARMFAFALAGAVTVAGVIAAISLMRDRDRGALRDIAVAAPAPAPAPVPRDIPPVEPAPRDAVAPPAGVEQIATVDAIALGHADVRFTAGARYAWHPDRTTLELRSGTAYVAVEPTPGVTFRVATSRFSVVVTGTELEVREDRVVVTEGQVQIVSPEGTLLDGDVIAGETWIPRAPVVTPVKPTPAARLARARGLIAKSDLDGARTELAAVLAGRPSAAHEAAARNLLADVARVAGDRDLAIRLYLEVARAFPQQPDGESALFEAARLEVRARRTDAARGLLREYLERYPRGRFHAEATARQTTLEGAP